MWTPATRRRLSREGLRYASDLTDDEWRILEPLLPGAPRRGRRRGYDAGKKIKGRTRHAMVDTDGRVLTLVNHPANFQDRDGAPPLTRVSRGRWTFVQLAFMDSGYAGDRVAKATAIRVEIVCKPKDQVGFAVRARRSVVDRFFARIGGNRPRRGLRGQATIASANTFVYAASVIILLRRVAHSA